MCGAASEASAERPAVPSGCWRTGPTVQHGGTEVCKLISLHAGEDTTAVLEKAMGEKKNGNAGLSPMSCSCNHAILQPGHSENELPDDVMERQALGCLSHRFAPLGTAVRLPA